MRNPSPNGRRWFGCLTLILAALFVWGCRPRDAAPPPTSGPSQEFGTASSLRPPPGPGRFETEWDRSNFDHGLWDRALQAHVDDRGRVAYEAMKRNAAFEQYLFRLSRTDADGLATDAERLAFWINAYNALTIQGVLDTLPDSPESWPDYRISEVRIGDRTLWKGVRFRVGGGEFTLDEIEHEILRKRDGLRDPRIHVALVCAARGCPPLWNRAFTAAAIDQQLTAAMRRFVADRNQMAVDVSDRVIRISRIFDWYGADFTNPAFMPHAESIPHFLANYCEEAAIAESLRKGDWRLEFNEYDWRLNIQG